MAQSGTAAEEEGRIASSPRLQKDVLLDADQALKQGAASPEVLAALALANAGRLNFVAAPLANGGGMTTATALPTLGTTAGAPSTSIKPTATASAMRAG